MAIIYTYPRISPGNKSLWVLVTDNKDEQKTKNINLEDFSRLIPEFIELNDFDLCGHPFVPVCPVPINDGDGIFYNATSQFWEIKPLPADIDTKYTLTGTENTNTTPSSFDVTLTGTDGSTDIVNIKPGNNVTFSISQDELIINSSGTGGGGSISVTDGTNTVNDVETINFIGAQVSGTSPTGDVTITSTNEVANAIGTTGSPATFLSGNYNKFNFVDTFDNAAVFAQEDATDSTQVNIFIPAPPTPTYPPYFNQAGALVTDPITRKSTRISNPVGESGAAGGFQPATGWIDNFKSSYNSSNTGSSQQPGPFVFTPGGASNYIIGFSGNSTESADDAVVNVKVYDSDGTTTFEDVTTPTLNGNATHSLGTNSCITVQVSNYSKIVDPYGTADQFRAYLSITIDIAQIFADNGRNGGTWSAKLKFVVDSGIPNPSQVTPAVPGGFIEYTLSPVFEDTNPLQPVAGTVNPTTINTVTNATTRFLSGVKYFTAGQTFSVTSVNTEGLNGNTQIGNNLGFSALANLNTNAITVNAWNPTAPAIVTGFSNSWDDTGVGFNYGSFAIQSSQFSYRGPAGQTILTAKDPWGPDNTNTNSNALDVLVLTKSNESTLLEEYFVDETYRLIRSGTSLTSYSSSTALTNSAQGTTTSGFQPNFSDACCIVSSGLQGSLIAANQFRLTDGVTIQPNLTGYNPDLTNNFTSFNQTPVYNRNFEYNSSTTQFPSQGAAMTFTGTFPGGNINTALNNADIKIYVRRIASASGGSAGPNGTAFALGTGFYNNAFWNDNAGVDTAASMIRTDASSGNVVNFVFGNRDANVGIYVEIQLIDTSIEINSITLNFTT